MARSDVQLPSANTSLITRAQIDGALLEIARKPTTGFDLKGREDVAIAPKNSSPAADMNVSAAPPTFRMLQQKV